MADRRDNLMEPRLESLLNKVESKFTLVTLSAMRAREINDYYGHLGEGLGKIVPPQVTSVSRKPLSIAMEEIREGKIIQGELKVVASAEEQEADEIVAAIEALSVVADEPGPDAG